MQLGLEGRRAVITGASQGIGVAIAEAFAAEGMNVAMLGRRQARLDEAAAAISAASGVVAMPIVADITLGVDVANAAAAVSAHPDFGGVDVLVNCAGMQIDMNAPPHLEWPDEKWLEHIQVKQLGALRMLREFRPLMSKQGSGRVINITGASGVAVTARALITGVNNAALAHMTRYFADELAVDNITANSVSPGVLASPGRVAALKSKAAGDGVSYEAIAGGIAGNMGAIIGRLGDISEVVDAVLYLVSDRARYITGTQICIDGGISINSRRI